MTDRIDTVVFHLMSGEQIEAEGKDAEKWRSFIKNCGQGVVVVDFPIDDSSERNMVVLNNVSRITEYWYDDCEPVVS